MPLDIQGTTLAQAPYYDDYDENKNFHRVLFKPSVAVQARELTQLQTILQNQIERFGDNVYRVGTIISGCALTTDVDYFYVKLNDLQVTGETYNITALSNTYATETSTELSALVVNYASGGQQLAPDMNTLYLKYLNTGTGGEKTFAPESLLKIYDRNYQIQSVSIVSTGTGYSNSDTVVFTGGGGTGAQASIVTTSTGALLTITVVEPGNGYTTAPAVSITTSTGSGANLVAINYLAQVQVANTTYGTAGGYTSNTVGVGTALKTSEGVIYQKGHFVHVEPHEVILSKYSTTPDGVSVGFVTSEAVVNSNSDQTLLDNASGASNYTAPGADRLKLTANLTVYTTAAAATAEGFLSLYEYQGGRVVKDRTNTQFNTLSKEMSRRTFEESGNYVVSPFGVFTEKITGNTSHLNVVVQPGIAYVEGNRVEILNNTRYPIPKATTTVTSGAQAIATSYGGYVYVNEAVGRFNITTGSLVYLRSAVGQAITNGTTSTPGIQVGTARVRSLVYDSGIPGTPDCVYRLYLFDVRMADAGFSFRDVRSIIDGSGAQCDTIVDPSLGRVVQYDLEFDRLLFSSGTTAIQQFTNERLVMRSQKDGAVAVGGTMAITTPSNGTLPYGAGTLNSIQEREFIIIPHNNITLSTAKTGTVATSSSSNTITGTGTRFSVEFNVGDYVSITGASGVHLITQISSNTSMQTAANIGSTTSGATCFTAFKAGVAINFGAPSRTITIDSTTQFTINLGDGISGGSSVNATAYFDYEYGATTAPQVRTKSVKTCYVKLSNASLTTSTNGPWTLGVPDAVELVGVYRGTGNVYTDLESTTNYVDYFMLDSGQTDNYYGLAQLKKRPGAPISLGTNNCLLVKFKAFDHTAGYYLSTESYSSAIDDATDPLPANKIRTSQIPVYVSPKTGGTFDLRDSLDFRPLAANTANTDNTANTATTDPSSSLSFDSDDKLFPSPEKYFTAEIVSYLGRRDRIVVNKNGQVQTVLGVPAQSPSAPVEPDGTMTLAVMNVPPYPSLGAVEAAEVGRPDLAALSTPVQNRRFTMKDISDIETRISRLEYYSLLNTLETQTKQLVLPGEADNTIERFKNGFFVDPMTDYSVSNLADPEYRMLIDTNNGIGRPYFDDTRIDLQFNSANSIHVTRKGDLVLFDYTEQTLISQPVATRSRTLVDKLWSYQGTLRTFPEFDNWHDVEARDTVVTIDIYSPIADLAAAVSSGLSVLNGESVLVRGPVDTGSAFQVSGGSTGTQVWRQTTESIYKDTKVTLAGGTAATTTSSVGSFVSDINVQRFIRSQRIFFIGTGLRPGATHHVFFEGDLVDAKVAPHFVDLTLTQYTRESFIQSGQLGDTLTANSSGCVVGSIDIPANTYFVGERSVVIMDVADLASEETSTSKAIGRFTAFGISTTDVNLQISTKSVNVAGGQGFAAQTYFSDTYAVLGERWYTTFVPNPDPLSQTFLVQPQSSTSDGVYLTSVDVFFQSKDPNIGVTLEIRETLNGVPSSSILPFSRVYLPSSLVNTSSDGTVATTFTFTSPVYVRNNFDYSLTLYPDSNSPEFRVFTAKTGQTDLTSPNTTTNQNWGLGTLFYSTSGRVWTAVQDEDLKFTLRRARFTESAGTVVLNNGDYEFFTMANTTGTMTGGEDVAQIQADQYFGTQLTTTTNSRTISLNENLTTDFATDKQILLIYGTSTGNTGVSSNVAVSNTTVTNASIGDINTNFETRYAPGSFVRFGNSTVGEIRQVVSIASNTSMTIDAPLNIVSTNIQQYQIATEYQVARITNITANSMTIDKASRKTSSTGDSGTFVTLLKTVKGVVAATNYGEGMLHLSNSSATANLKFLASNTTYLGTIVGDSSQAQAHVASIDDITCNFFTPIFSKVIVPGTSMGLEATVLKQTASANTTNVYELGMVNKFEFNDAAKIKSKSNENGVKSFAATLSFSGPTTSDDTSPALDINPISIIVTKNIIDQETAEIVYSITSGSGFAVGETVLQGGTGATGRITSVTSSTMVLDQVIGKFAARGTLYTIQGQTSGTVASASQVFDETTVHGKGKSKYVSKRLTLAEGMDAEDIKVFLTAYKPVNTEIDVYARVLNFTDGQAFEEKDWTLLNQVTSASVYSDSYDQTDYREYEYTFPYSPPSVRKTGRVSTTANSAVITGSETSFTTEFVADDLIKVVRSNSDTDYEILRIASVANNTQMTATTVSQVSGGVTGGTIEYVTQPRAAFKYNKNSSIVRYYDSNGAAYDTYKYLAIKIVLKSPYTYLVPTIDDVRALAVST